MREPIINERIRAREVRVVDETGGQLGVLSLSQALESAYQKGLDLILVSPSATPPVCRIGDVGKFKYELSKKEKESRRSQRVGGLKEVKLSTKIAKHDFEVRVVKGREFLEKHCKVKVSLLFKGRERAHVDLGRKVMQDYLEAVAPISKVDIAPRMEGRSLIMLLAPK